MSTIRNARVSKGFVVLALVLTLLPQAASAWNDTGQWLVALVAWERLDDTTRAALIKVLRAHERFNADFKDKMPESIRAADAATQNRWIFLQATIWPDLARD